MLGLYPLFGQKFLQCRAAHSALLLCSVARCTPYLPRSWCAAVFRVKKSLQILSMVQMVGHWKKKWFVWNVFTPLWPSDLLRIIESTRKYCLHIYSGAHISWHELVLAGNQEYISSKWGWSKKNFWKEKFKMANSKNWVFQLRQFSIFFLETFRDWFLG